MTTKTNLNDTWTEVADTGESFWVTTISTTPAEVHVAASAPDASAPGHPLRDGQWVDRGPSGKVFARSAITGQTAVVVVSKDAV